MAEAVTRQVHPEIFFKAEAEKMVATTTNSYDRNSELKAFDDSKAGVKGLIDAGLTKIPRFFVHDRPITDEKSSSTLDSSQVSIPIIDFTGIDGEKAVRSEIIEKIRVACENWGFFQIINHGIPASVLTEMIQGVRGFHELETESKKIYYSREFLKKVVYTSNFHLYKGAPAIWCDTFLCVLAPNPAHPQQLPSDCRDIINEYSNYIMRLGITLLELLSEALGLKPNHLKDMGCAEGLFLLGHYYPACPEPELTFGANNHTDAGFFTILLQDVLGGLQVLHENRWIHVSPQPGALVINIADLLQLLTNDKFKSVSHRVLAQKVGPRISIATFFRTYHEEGNTSRVYRPIKELISEENPPIYRETALSEYLTHRINNSMEETSMLAPFKVTQVQI